MSLSVNVQKFVLLLVGLVATVTLMLTGTITPDVGMPIISGVTMYSIGNGIAAKSGVHSPLIAPKRDDTADD